jgi:hypothetical protein
MSDTVRPKDMTAAEKDEERYLVKAAEEMVDRAWRRAPRAQTSDSPAAQAWRSRARAGSSYELYRSPYYGHPLHAAKAQARAAAREDYRALLYRERQERMERTVELPAHIARVAPTRPGITTGYVQYEHELQVVAAQLTDTRDRLKSALQSPNAADPRAAKFIADKLEPALEQCQALIDDARRERERAIVDLTPAGLSAEIADKASPG